MLDKESLCAINEIQYLGNPNVTQMCIRAVCRLLQYENNIGTALLLTAVDQHAFIFKNDLDEVFVIKGGFSSGYQGEGPKGLATVLHILDCHQIDIEELWISPRVMCRLNDALLTIKDLESIALARPVRPKRLADYTYPYSEDLKLASTHARYYPVMLPYALIDRRIFDLALRFCDDPDAVIVSAYRRLEDVVRSRINSTESSAKLFAKAFVGKESILTWNVPDESESIGRGNLFTAIYNAFRNARAHRELSLSASEEFREFMLINELFLLEAAAVNR